jgi:hypothetical protein
MNCNPKKIPIVISREEEDFSSNFNPKQQRGTVFGGFRRK